MKKIIDYIYMETSWLDNTDFVAKATNYDNNTTFYYFQIKQKLNKNNNYRYIYLIDIVKLFQAILSLIIFIILYIFNIQLLVDNLIYIIKWIVIILLIIYILRLIDIYITALYSTLEDFDKNEVMLGIKLFSQLINFIINIIIIYCVLGLSINLLIQFNVLLLINCIVFLLFYIYKNVFDYEIEGKKITTFLSYPWILLIINIIFLLLYKKKINSKYIGINNHMFSEYGYFLKYVKENKE